MFFDKGNPFQINLNLILAYICIKIDELEATIRVTENNDVLTILMVASFLILAVIRTSYPRRFTDFLTLIVSSKFFNVHGKEDTLQHPFNILFFLFQIINVTVLLHLISEKLIHYEFSPWGFLQVGTLYCVFVLGKVLVEKIIGNILSIDAVIAGYLYEKLSYRNYLSLLIFVGNLLFSYVFPSAIHFLKIFISVILISNLAILFSIFRRNWNVFSHHISYFILYLCAPEISPYLILYYLIF